MLIRYGAIVLADGDRGDAVSGLTLGGQRVVQVEALPGATTVTLFPRGNRAVTVSFSITRQHADVPTASAFIIELPDQLKDTALLRLLATGAQGARVERFLPGACLESYEGRQTGCTTFHRFTFQAATITKTSPKTV